MLLQLISFRSWSVALAGVGLFTVIAWGHVQAWVGPNAYATLTGSVVRVECPPPGSSAPCAEYPVEEAKVSVPNLDVLVYGPGVQRQPDPVPPEPIIDPAATLSALTGKEGTYRIERVAIPSFRGDSIQLPVTVQKAGFISQTKPAVLHPDSVDTLDFELVMEVEVNFVLLADGAVWVRMPAPSSQRHQQVASFEPQSATVLLRLTAPQRVVCDAYTLDGRLIEGLGFSRQLGAGEHAIAIGGFYARQARGVAVLHVRGDNLNEMLLAGMRAMK
jgi:hypothetical protein